MSDRASLAALTQALAQARVACVGDVMLDHFVRGEVERISPEAPIPVLRLDPFDSGMEEAKLGGAGNVARNLHALGSAVRFISVVGNDDAGREVRKQYGDLGIDESGLIVDDGRRTSVKTRFLAGSQQLLRTDLETAVPLRPAVRERLLQAAAAALTDCTVMVLSDYGKGVLANGVAADLIRLARDNGMFVAVDPKAESYEAYRGAALVTPNRRELKAAARMPVDTHEAVAAAARRLIADHGLGAVLATLGADGMILVEDAGAPFHLAAEAREVFDVSGAGDTVVATTAAAVAAGAALAEAARLANVAAGIVVGKVGTAVAYPGDVIAALLHRDLERAEAKVQAIEPALDRIRAWRRRGFRIGFTNGCFDLLHPGHVSLLHQARVACDRLVVGLNDDASVGRLKGPGRPLQSEAARATVLASLATVDMVVMFADDTPRALIEAIRPDVLVKGADYRLDQVVGAELVQRWGGRVLLVELEPGHSTTATIARMVR